MEQQYGIFAYEEDLREPEELEDPETEILGEENDLPTSWQVQFHLAESIRQEDREYLTDTETQEEDAYTQQELDTGVTPVPQAAGDLPSEQRRVNDYAAAD